MPVKSMTGFGRMAGQEGDAAWSWEIRTVNNKGLDIRMRLAPGLEELEPRLRDAVAKRIKRGSCSISLALKAPEKAGDFRLNEAVLLKLVELAERARRITGHQEQVSLHDLLAMKGVIEISDLPAADEGQAAFAEALLASFQTALGEVVAARRTEGEKLKVILSDKLNEIEALTREAEGAPERRPEAIRERLRLQIQRLLAEGGGSFDEARLHQEAMLLATKADIEEEIQRLHAHISAARELLAGDEPSGRRLEFLAQEFQREANTLCSKANATAITQVGLKLKAAIDQVREQVQNVE
jgi:uncharacterized protein (TIGR00255 family)